MRIFRVIFSAAVVVSTASAGLVTAAAPEAGAAAAVNYVALGAPVLVDIRTYPVKVTDGTVYLDVGA